MKNKLSKLLSHNLTPNRCQVHHVDWPDEDINEKTLYVVSANSNPLSRQEIRKIKSIDLPNREESFKIHSTS